MGYSKWIFGTLGFALSGTPIGALVGFAVGSLFDNATDRQAPPDQAPPRPGAGSRSQQHHATAGDVALSLVVLTAAVMKADGRATQAELGHARQFFNRQFGPQHAAELIRLLRDMLQRTIPLRDVCEQMKHHLAHPERLQLLHYLIGLAHADGGIDTAERQVIQTIAYYLGISEKDLAALHAMFVKATPNAAYEVLEVDPKASDEEVKKAYRRAAIKHHPDKVAHLGEQFQKDAAEKFKKVQEAWDRVKKERGMS
ncbi:MAG: TerB family tellurite resistance protein [Flavobacteriales bacterium]|nr:TerB family tellurite resistance protein [Flavobacteriales bacterium]